MVVMKIKSKMKASSHLTMPHTKRSGALNLTVKMRKTGKPAEYTRMIWANSIPSVRPLCVCVCRVSCVCVWSIIWQLDHWFRTKTYSNTTIISINKEKHIMVAKRIRWRCMVFMRHVYLTLSKSNPPETTRHAMASWQDCILRDSFTCEFPRISSCNVWQ